MKSLLGSIFLILAIIIFSSVSYAQSVNPSADGDAGAMSDTVGPDDPNFTPVTPTFNPEYPYGMPQTNVDNLEFLNTQPVQPEIPSYTPQVPPVPKAPKTKPPYVPPKPKQPAQQYYMPPQTQPEPEIHYVPVPTVERPPRTYYKPAQPKILVMPEDDTTVYDDEQVVEDTDEVEPVYSVNKYYRLQVGAFNSLERAKVSKYQSEKKYKIQFVVLKRCGYYLVQTKNLYNWNNVLKKKRYFKNHGTESLVKSYKIKK